MTVLRFQSPFARQRTVSTPPRPSRVARMLALAHLVERLVAQGRVKSYSEVARKLGG